MIFEYLVSFLHTGCGYMTTVIRWKKQFFQKHNFLRVIYILYDDCTSKGVALWMIRKRLI